MDTTRGSVPAAFAVDACFDGSDLKMRNQLTLALTPVNTGEIEHFKTSHSDYGLAALATRALGGDEQLFLPGDTVTFRVGVGSASAAVKGSQYGGFYALATTLATFVPGKTAGAVGAFTDMIKELDDVFTKYRNCLDGRNWVSQLKCRAIFVRDVQFAIARAGVKGLAKEALNVILSGVSFTKWADAQVPEVRKVLNSGRIRLAPDPKPPLTPSSSCRDWKDASIARRDQFTRGRSPGIELAEPVPTDPALRAAFMYGFIFGGCDRAEERGHDPRKVTLAEVIAGDHLP